MLNYQQISGPLSGKTPTVFIHGLLGSLENLGAIARQYSAYGDAYLIDLPDHGQSAHTGSPSLALYAERIQNWLLSKNLQRANLVGHSLGGKVAMELALSSPDYIERLVVMDMAPAANPARHDNVFSGLKAVHQQTITRRNDADAILSEFVEDKSTRTFLLKNLVRDDGVFRWRINLEGLHQNYHKILSGNSSGEFEGEVLFLKGANSDYIRREHQCEIESRFPNFSFKQVEGTGHWLHAEKPELVARLVNNFLVK